MAVLLSEDNELLFVLRIFLFDFSVISKIIRNFAAEINQKRRI